MASAPSGASAAPGGEQGNGITAEMAISLSPKRRKNTYVPQPPTQEPKTDIAHQMRMADSKMDLKRLSGYLHERNNVLNNADGKKQKRAGSPRHAKNTRCGSPGGTSGRAPKGLAGPAGAGQDAFVFHLFDNNAAAARAADDPAYDSDEAELLVPSLEHLIDGDDTANVRRAIKQQAKEAASAANDASDIPNTGETNAAAAKVQAIQRGNAARREVDAIRGAQVGAAETANPDEEAVDIPDNAETNAAAARVQAIQRGKTARKEVEAMRSTDQVADAAGDGAEDVDIPDNDETNAAAAKLQAIQRGNTVRKEVEAKRAA